MSNTSFGTPKISSVTTSVFNAVSIGGGPVAAVDLFGKLYVHKITTLFRVQALAIY